MLRGLDQLMERKEGGDMYLLWVPLIGDVRTLMMDEAHASRLPRSSSGYDTNWVIVDRLTKIVAEDLLRGFGRHCRRHWEHGLNMRMTYHPQMDGQSMTSLERDRLLVIEFGFGFRLLRVVEGLYFDPSGYAWCYTYAYIQEGVTFIAKSKSHMVLGIASAAIIDRQLPFKYTITSRSTDVVVMALPVQNINHLAFREKLSRTNFNDWLRRLKLVLRVKKKMFVIEQPIPPAPAANSEANVLAEWNALYDAYKVVGLSSCLETGVERFDLIQTFMLATMSGEVVKSEKANKEIVKAKHPTKDDTCHHCKEVGHWKRNCPVFLAELLKKKKQVGTASSSGIFTIELFAFPNKSWVYDTGYGTHVCITKQGFREAWKLKQGALYLYVGNGVRAQVEAIGSFDLVLPNGLVICLDNCHYAPSITRGVVSVHRLVENEFVQCFTDFGISVSKNNVHYFNAIPSNGIPKGKHMGYYFYFPPENKIVARYAEFFEKNLITQEVSRRAEGLEEIHDEDTSPSEITSEIPMEG
ncbi:retrotransposon protein, putative, ty1-copia subclass [Tanacetum coccineum]